MISNNRNAYALERARKHDIPADVYLTEDYESREAFNDAFLDQLQQLNPDLIVLAGFLSLVIPEKVIRQYEHRMINIHPSLIPAFCGKGYYGLKVHEAALNREVVAPQYILWMKGQRPFLIILQKAVEVKNGDTPESLQRRVMEEAEWRSFPQAIDLIANGKIELVDGKAVVRGE